MPLFVDKNGQMYHKVFFSKEELLKYINSETKNQKGMLFSINTIENQTPAMEISYLCTFMHDSDSFYKLSLQSFPQNWGYKRIINFLIEKINKETYSFSWEKEVLPEVKKHGLHKDDDFSKPYFEM